MIGQDVQTQFFPPSTRSATQLRMGGIPYTVVGVAEKQGSIFGQSLDKFVIAPYRAPIHRLLNDRRGVIDAIIVQAVYRPGVGRRPRAGPAGHAHAAPAALRNSLTISLMETPESALAFWQKIQTYLVFAAVVLPAIGLVVGAIVIMNIMLVAVAERTREIGIRKSLGARRRDILAQFLIEAATLSTIGAAVGIGLGVGIAMIVRHTTFMPVYVVPWSVVVALVVGAGVGIVSGVYPASRAARLDPIVALRQE